MAEFFTKASANLSPKEQIALWRSMVSQAAKRVGEEPAVALHLLGQAVQFGAMLAEHELDFALLTGELPDRLERGGVEEASKAEVQARILWHLGNAYLASGLDYRLLEALSNAAAQVEDPNPFKEQLLRALAREPDSRELWDKLVSLYYESELELSELDGLLAKADSFAPERARAIWQTIVYKAANGLQKAENRHRSLEFLRLAAEMGRNLGGADPSFAPYLEQPEQILSDEDQELMSLLGQSQQEASIDPSARPDGLARELMRLLGDAIVARDVHQHALSALSSLEEQPGLNELYEDLLERAEERYPENAKLLNALGYHYADKTENYERAYVLLQRAVRINPNDYNYQDSLGWAAFKLGRAREAHSLILRSIKLMTKVDAEAKEGKGESVPDTVRAEVLAYLGEVLWTLDEKAAAKERWSEALAKYPQDTKLLEAIRRLAPELLSSPSDRVGI
jgi:tetratricopeptide (TPR) repeat protein